MSQVLEKADGTPEEDRDEEDSGTNMWTNQIIIQGHFLVCKVFFCKYFVYFDHMIMRPVLWPQRSVGDGLRNHDK